MTTIAKDDVEVTIQLKAASDHTPNKLADAEVTFHEGIFKGLRMLGFTVWTSVNSGDPNVTFPARAYSTSGGERRKFILLRPQEGQGDEVCQPLRAVIIQAYVRRCKDK